MFDEQVVDTVLLEVDTTIGPQEKWEAWPGGWVDDIQSALLDAVFSSRAVYKTVNGKGVHAQLVEWQRERSPGRHSLRRLRAEIDELGPEQWMSERFHNGQHAPSRPETAPGGSSKAATVRQAADVLIEYGHVDVAGDISIERVPELRMLLRSVPGIGYATTNYFFMLLGYSGVKPDRMVHRYLKQATRRTFTDDEASVLLTQAAERLSVAPHELEHAIWKWQSDRAALR